MSYIVSYIVASSRNTPQDKPGVSYQVDTPLEALEKVMELQANGYQVLVQTTGGEELSIDDLKARAVD